MKEIETEEVEILKISTKNGQVIITSTDDSNKYQILGILKTYTKALEEELTLNWTEE